MKQTLVILLFCIPVFASAQAPRLVGTIWAIGNVSFECRALKDSLFRFDAARDADVDFELRLRPDGNLYVLSADDHPGLTVNGVKVLYREVGDQRCLIFTNERGDYGDVLRPLPDGKSLEQLMIDDLIGQVLVGTYTDSLTHAQVIIGATSVTIPLYQDLPRNVLRFNDGKTFYFEVTDSGLDLFEPLADPTAPGFYGKGRKITTLIKKSWDFTFASTRIVSQYIMVYFTLNQQRLIRNEIYARHGYRFKSPDLIAYFSAKPWYVPRYDDVTNQLNGVERINVMILK